MPRLLLIPGFATELRVAPVRPPLGADAGFSSLRAAVAGGDAVTFRWGIAETIPFGRAWDPRAYARLYWRERERAESAGVAERLQQELERAAPDTIVCHSMGALVLMNAARRYGLPDSVKRIVFVQADVGAQDTPPPAFAGRRVENLFCAWDPSLAVSRLLHREPRAGQKGWRVNGVQNVSCPLLRPFNPHTASIRSPKLRLFLQK